MSERIELVLAPEVAFDEEAFQDWMVNHPPFGPGIDWKLFRRSIDARGRTVKVRLLVDRWEEASTAPFEQPAVDVKNAAEVHIIGAGPGGLFAALECISQGRKPIVLERGKDVRARRRDLVRITRDGVVDEDSNYCFGEGGAGTYSDGKLYTRASKRGDVRRVLQQLVWFGAPENILIDAHPHVGTNKLPAIIERIRQFILDCGGEIHFETKVTAFLRESDRITALQLQNGARMPVQAVLLATGHSARDVFEMLHSADIYIEAKPLAIGLRIEHPQTLIDRLQYHCDSRGDYLPPASYSIVQQAKGRGVYSFCMCPGGIIAPCATGNEEVVTNGWSPSKRNNPFANAGFVVELALEDGLRGGPEAFSLLRLQQEVERKAWLLGGGKQIAPAQRMVDFVVGKGSGILPDCSYRPGIHAVELKEVFPRLIHERLALAFREISKRMPQYFTNDAVLVAPESRTSSPVRIPRDSVSRAHPQIKNLFPVGEGAGFAGGIVSAAIDGQLSAHAASLYI